MRVGERIEQTRQRRALTYREAAEELDVDASAVLRWTAGSTLPHRERLPRIAQWCEVDLDVLVAEWRTDTADKRQGVSLAPSAPLTELDSVRAELRDLREAFEALDGVRGRRR